MNFEKFKKIVFWAHIYFVKWATESCFGLIFGLCLAQMNFKYFEEIVFTCDRKFLRKNMNIFVHFNIYDQHVICLPLVQFLICWKFKEQSKCDINNVFEIEKFSFSFQCFLYKFTDNTCWSYFLMLLTYKSPIINVTIGAGFACRVESYTLVMFFFEKKSNFRKCCRNFCVEGCRNFWHFGETLQYPIFADTKSWRILIFIREIINFWRIVKLIRFPGN